MNNHVLTIKCKFAENEFKEYQISDNILKKYPESIFNFFKDFNTNTIDMDSENLSCDEFEQVIEVLKGEKYPWQITNKMVKKYLKKNGIVDNVYEKLGQVRKTKLNNIMEGLKDFVNSKMGIYAAENYDLYNDLKKILPYNNVNIISVQYIVHDNFLFININETIPLTMEYLHTKNYYNFYRP